MHPKFAQGSEFLITIDWKTVLSGQVSGTNMTKAHSNELLAKFGVQPDSKQALEYHETQAAQV